MAVRQMYPHNPHTMSINLILGADSIHAPLTGIGRYAFELAQGLPQHPQMGQVRYFSLGRWVTLESLLGADGASTSPQHRSQHSQKHSQHRDLRSILAGNRAAVQVFRWLMPPLQRLRLRGQGDAIYHAPNYFLPPFAGRTVATVHDLSHHIYPQFHPATRVDYMRRMLPDTLRRADHLITDAESVRQELIQYFDYPAHQITAIPLGASPAFGPQSATKIVPVLVRLGLGPHSYHGYSLYVGTIEPRKNLDRLLTAYENLPATLRQHHPLVIAGATGWQSEHTHERMARAASAGWLHYLRYVPQADLPFLYAGARVFVYPSLYEGFGLPVLEAMASGVPVITSNTSSLPEVVGTAALQIAPEDTVALTAALLQGLQDEVWRNQARSRGLERASQFGWKRCIDQTVQVYANLVPK